MSTPSKAAAPSLAALGTLLGSGLATSALAVYQWVELFVVLAGGKPACAVNDTVNCATVWSSPFAVRVQELTGMPVAATGLVWGLSATVLAGLAWWLVRQGQSADRFLAAVKVVAAVGALSVVTLATASVRAGAVCVACLGTYALVLTYAGAAFRLLPGPLMPTGDALKAGVARAGVVTAACFLALLYPGQQTKKPGSTNAFAGQKDRDALIRTIETLPEREALFTSAARDLWLKGQPRDTSMLPGRVRWGPADAKVKVVEFTDILCGHCRMFEVMMEQLKQSAPAGSLSVEPRYYPLDGECNPEIKRTIGDGVRCTGAKVQLCLEQHPAFWEVRHALFDRQAELTKDLILDVASAKAGMSRDALWACVQSPETQKKLNDDILYGKLYGIEGTPLVLLNGKATMPAPAFILGMALSGGDADAPYFLRLPPPPPP